MSLQVWVYTAPSVEPVTLAECKTDLRVDHSDDDTLITNLIIAARQRAEELSGRAFVNRVLDMALDAWPDDDHIVLPYPPASAVTAITYYDEDNVSATLSASDYTLISDVQPAVIMLKKDKSWPSTALRPVWPIRVRWTAGYGTSAGSVPEHFKQLIRALVAIRYEFRDEISPQGQAQVARIEQLLRWGTVTA